MSETEKARNMLKEVVKGLRAEGHQDWADQIDDIVDGLLYREKPARGRMPTKSNKVTDKIRQQIRELGRTTKMHNSEIAAKLGVNPGRVSEVLHEED